jgi:hypothetical protein
MMQIKIPVPGAAILFLVTLACAADDAPRAATPAIVVHVNQVVLERSGPKSAIIEYTGSQTSGRYSVLADGSSKPVAGALVALPEFTEWGGGKQYFKADFSSLAANGSYRLEATLGDQSAQSAAFKVADNAVFATTASAVLDYFKANRHTKEADKKIRIFDTDRYVNVWGGWKDAGGDNGKYLSHLSYANFFNPQQTPLVVWALAKSYESVPQLYRQAKLDTRVIDEVMWGADYLHRLLDPSGYFYLTVFDRWATPGAERMVTGYEGIDGVYTKNYQAAFREGGGVSIAALARAARLSTQSGVHGEFSGTQYLQDAEQAFAHLQQNNLRYVDNGVENIIDDYTALLAAIELFRATSKDDYLQAARQRATNLNNRMSKDGWFVSDARDRPYYHGADAGFPILALAYYLDIETDHARQSQAKSTIAAALNHQLALNRKVSNPYNYARQDFRIYKDGKLGQELRAGYFMPHANETKYWWQGESARLASLATAAIVGGRIIAPDANAAFGVREQLAEFAQNQLDWTLGRNPFDMCLLYGFGTHNPPAAISAGDMVKGGISNGITGATLSDEGRGIVFAPGPDDNNWRWLEQWLPHSTWFLLAATAMTEGPAPPSAGNRGKER